MKFQRYRFALALLALSAIGTIYPACGDSYGDYVTYNQHIISGNIPGSSYSIADYGCAICAVSSMLTHYGAACPPEELINWGRTRSYWEAVTGFIFWDRPVGSETANPERFPCPLTIQFRNVDVYDNVPAKTYAERLDLIKRYFDDGWTVLVETRKFVSPNWITHWTVIRSYENNTDQTGQTRGYNGSTYNYVRYPLSFLLADSYYAWPSYYNRSVYLKEYPHLNQITGIRAYKPLFTPGKISGRKWFDRNGNAARDPEDNYLNGWAIQLLQNGAVIQTYPSTGADGYYEFTGLAAGTYTVQEVQKAGWRQTYPAQTTYAIEVTSGTDSQNNDFGNTLGSITVLKFLDINTDGIKDAGEDHMSGWTIKLLKLDSGGDYQEADLKTTDSSGKVSFTGLEGGTYAVTEEFPGLTWIKIARASTNTDWQTSDGEYRFTKAALDGAIFGFDYNGYAGTTPRVHGIVVNADDHNVTFGNVPLGSITPLKFQDCDMDGVQDPSEGTLSGWPFVLTGTTAGGTSVGPVNKPTNQDGKCTFSELLPGTYKVTEQGTGLAWNLVTTVYNGQNYYDWRGTMNGIRWQSTKPAADASSSGDGPSYNGLQILGNDLNLSFGNVPLGKVTAFKFHDLNMNEEYEPIGEPYSDLDGNGRWTNQEPFTDLDGNSIADEGKEYYNDLDGDGKWDPAEPFTDLDGDGRYDYPEAPIENWPIKMIGNRADGRPVTFVGGNTNYTDANGNVIFADVPPSDAIGYSLNEDLPWSTVNLPDERVHRASYDQAKLPCSCNHPCKITRWQAVGDSANDHDILRTFVLSCGADHNESFANVCLAPVIVNKEVFDDGVPGQVPAKPGVGWRIALSGKDVRGQSVVPSSALNTPIMTPCSPPIDIPCETDLLWYEVLTDASGKAVFYDLLPGHYHMTEQPYPGYRLSISSPSLCGFDMMCCPKTFTLRNIKQGVPIRVYQAYPGTTNGLAPIDTGYLGGIGDTISAVPGVLAINPGKNWKNFKQATQVCRESPPKTTIFTKKFEPFAQCADVFGPISIAQQGTSNIRTWWPLMYEPPTTTWTLKLLYGTKTAVQLPGESKAQYVHIEEWKWVMDTDLPHLSLYLDLLHELPFGKDEVPLISDESLYVALKEKIAGAQEAFDAGDLTTAGMLLGDFELEVMDACIGVSPSNPNPHGVGTGIAQTEENPACCKLLVDIEYIGKSLGAFLQGK